MARYFSLRFSRRFSTKQIVFLLFGALSVFILLFYWKLFSNYVLRTQKHHIRLLCLHQDDLDQNNKPNKGYFMNDHNVTWTHSDHIPNGTNNDRSYCREVTVLILGFHFDSWSNTLSSTRDRFITCSSLNMCVRAHYRPTRNDWFSYNVVLFSHRYMKLRNVKSSSWLQLLKRRHRSQRWVMFSLEPPVRVGLNTSVPKRARALSFHWTSTYDLHSDIPLPYGRYSKFESPKLKLPFDGLTLLSSKTGLVAFVSSNCNMTRWPRIEFVEQFQRVLNIDTFGKCGVLKCDPNCTDVLKRYKFILALENAPCQGYITEKFWNALEITQSVPIVFGPSKEDYEAIAPPNSFIYIQDFPSMTSLAKYIIELDEHNSDYLAYHSWRNNGTLTSIVHDWSKLPFDETFCDIAGRYEKDMKLMSHRTPTTFRDVNGADWLGTCQVHAIRPRGIIDHLPIPID